MAEKSEATVKTFFKTFSGKDSNAKDAEEFKKLVSTYIEKQKWVTRPLVLSPTVCSQYGWKCISSQLLECVTCGAKLCAPDPQIELYGAYKASIHKILKDLKTSHKTHCPWPLVPASDSFIKMVSMPKEESLKHFLQRLKTSLTFSSNFPNIKEDFLQNPEFNSQHISALCKLAEVPITNVNIVRPSAVCLAGTGWTFNSQSITNSKVFIKCDSCQRSIWTNSLNLLKISEENENCKETSSEAVSNCIKQNTSPEESPVQKFKRLRKEDFDPISEHRSWCQWVISEDSLTNLELDAVVENPEVMATLPGWKIFMKSLLRNICLPQQNDKENTPSKEEIRTVRDLLETWNDAVQ